ncbi:MAG: adenylosuccinate synthase [Acidobacteriota bacterium]
MANLVIVGGQWGDEGKGKVVDLLAARADIVARYQGGPNAGHTITLSEKRYALHHIPCGILYPGKTCVIGNGVVVDPGSLLREIRDLATAGVEVAGRLFLSDRCHVIFPYHRELDRIREERIRKNRLGTTCLGIGPSYESKSGRKGVRVVDLKNRDLLQRSVEQHFRADDEGHSPVIERIGLDIKRVIDEYVRFGDILNKFSIDTSAFLQRAIREGRSILCEGAQGTMLDLDHGTYPYVTSSNPTAGGASIGLGIGPTQIDAVLGVFKAYTSRVGEGPFPTELREGAGEHLRERGHEYGTTTGRPRRVGWFDAVAARYAVRLNGMKAMALTLLDVLDDQQEIPVCVAYKYRNSRLTELPSEPWVLEQVSPEYEMLKGWQKPLGPARELGHLPVQARDYVRRLSDLVECPMALVSVGSSREQTIHCEGSLLPGWL